MQQENKMSQTSCHEDTTDVNASMVTADLSSNQHTESIMDKHDAIGASQLASSSKTIHTVNNADFKYVSVGNCRTRTHFNSYSDELLHKKLSEDPEKLENLKELWGDAERVMGRQCADTCKVLRVYGIGEGEEDSESEEGQLWRMVQGDAPYTLNLI